MATTDTSLRQRGYRAVSEGRLARGVSERRRHRGGDAGRHGAGEKFFLRVATIVTAAGIAAPLTVIATAVAIGLLGNTLSSSRAHDRRLAPL